MKVLIKYYFILLLLIVLTGCYYDLGSYNYKNTPQVDFEDVTTVTYSFLAGETFEIDAPIRLSSTTDDIENQFIIEWYLDKRLIYTGIHLKYRIEDAGAYGLIIKVRNRETGEIFLQDRPLTIKIKNKFEWGWMILSDTGDGKSSLSFITPDLKAFNKIEKGIEGGLGEGPRQLLYYYVLGSIPGSYVSGLPKIIVNQSSGTVTLDGNTLQKDMWLADEFENAKEPDNLIIKDFGFKIKYYAIFSNDGKVYIRGVGYDNHSIPYYGKYSSSPYEFEGGAHISCVSTFHNNTFHCFNEKNCMLYDSLHNRYICITDSGYPVPYFPDIVYLRTYDQNLQVPSSVLKVDNMGEGTRCLAIGAYENVDIEGQYHALVMWANYISLIDINGTGNYQIHEFSVNKMSGKSHLITATDQYSFSGAALINDNSIIRMSSNFSKNPYFYFTDGDKKLYAYNMKLRRHILIYEASDRITGLSCSPIVSEFSEYGGHSTDANFKMAVAQKNGRISIIDIHKSLLDNILNGIISNTHIKSFDGFGNIKDIVWCTNYEGEY